MQSMYQPALLAIVPTCPNPIPNGWDKTAFNACSHIESLPAEDVSLPCIVLFIHVNNLNTIPEFPWIIPAKKMTKQLNTKRRKSFFLYGIYLYMDKKKTINIAKKLALETVAKYPKTIKTK